jgi:ABC-type glycerol-3-phosphate transport system substrate-binding protein
MSLNTYLRSVLLLLPFLLAACAGQAELAQGVAETEAISQDATPTSSGSLPTPTVANAATEESAAPTTLHVWWPEPLAPIDNEDAADVLSAQISGFQNANPGMLVDLRLKAVPGIGGQEVGGLLSILQSASAVAPGALPDLTLLRRSDLLEAVQAGLLQRLRVSASLLDDLHPAVVGLGSIDEAAYGLAYMVDVEHLAINRAAEVPERWRFEDVLDSQFAYVFPAGRTNMLSDSFLVQYLNAGQDLTAGQDLLLSGELAIDANVLRSVYEFYQQAAEMGVIDSLVLEYISANDYATSLVQGDVNAGVVPSTLYLTLLDEGAELDYGLIPTQTGEPATVVDGWMWVITTTDAGQQEAALRFLNWMMNVDRQGAYADAVHMLPSLRTALRAWSDSSYATFVDSLLTRATLPLSDIGGGTPARVMQSALAMVISGQRTADQATREVIAQLSG